MIIIENMFRYLRCFHIARTPDCIVRIVLTELADWLELLAEFESHNTKRVDAAAGTSKRALETLLTAPNTEFADSGGKCIIATNSDTNVSAHYIPASAAITGTRGGFP